MEDSDSLDGIDWDEQEQLAIQKLKDVQSSGIVVGANCQRGGHTIRSGRSVLPLSEGISGPYRLRSQLPSTPQKRYNKVGRRRGGGSGGRKYGKSPSKAKSGIAWSVAILPVPNKPFERCPGVYKECGGDLKLGVVRDERYWYCMKGPPCRFQYKMEPQMNTPVLSLEIVSVTLVKICPTNGAESAVLVHGGVKSVLEKAGIDMKKHEPVAVNSTVWKESGLHREEFGSDVIFFKLDEYACIEDVLNQHGRNLLHRGSSVMRSVLRHLRGSKNFQESQDEVERRWKGLTPGFLAALMPFQRSGIHFGLEKGGRCLIADEMGLGKTLQAIALAVCYQDEWPLLIIAPASLRLVWAEELEKWLPRLRPSDIHVIEGKRDALRVDETIPKVTITSFEMLKRLSCEPCCKGLAVRRAQCKSSKGCHGSKLCLGAMGFGVVIVDESHNLRATKNRRHDAGSTEACVSVTKRAKRSVLLTGTPSLSKPFDLYRQVDALRPGLLSSDRNLFADRYCSRKLCRVGYTDDMRYDVSGASHFHELHLLLSQTIMIRRLKKDVMSQLPPKRRQVVRLPCPSSHHWPSKSGAKIQSSQDSDLDESDEDEILDEECQEGNQMNSDRRTGIAKLPNAIAWMKDAIRFQDTNGNIASQSAALHEVEPPKVLIFAHHRDVMDSLAAEFEDIVGSGGYVRIDGSYDATERMEAVRNFKCDPDVKVALLSITAAGVGLDFSAASVIVFVELPKEVALVRQAEDRAHRKGQEKAVNVYFLCAKGTVDDSRWQHLCRSLDNISAVLDGTGSVKEAVETKGKGAGGCAGVGLTIDDVFEVAELEDAHPKPLNRYYSSEEPASGVDKTVCPFIPASELIDRGQKDEQGPRRWLSEENFWFEVSKNTSRIHVHCSEDGKSPLLSIPIECLLANKATALCKLKEALMEVVRSGEFVGIVEPFGLIEVSKDELKSFEHIELMMVEVQEFAREWNELRSVIKNKLFGVVLPGSLDVVIDEISSRLSCESGKHNSTERYISFENMVLPKGVSLVPIQVLFPYELNPRDYKQPVSIVDQQRLCLLCFQPVSDICAPADGLLHNHAYLFCSGECEVAFGVKTSSSALRRELFLLERGVCQLCGLHCRDLVRKLRAIGICSKGWKAKRRQIIKSFSKKMSSFGYKKLHDRLVRHAVEGYAWHADHILPVYKGGGGCGIENLRTLCVACHADVTKEQIKERKAIRDAEKARLQGDDLNLAPDTAQLQGRLKRMAMSGLQELSKKPRVSRLKPLYGKRVDGLESEVEKSFLATTSVEAEPVPQDMGMDTDMFAFEPSTWLTDSAQDMELGAADKNVVQFGSQEIFSSGSCEDLNAYIMRRLASPEDRNPST